MNRHFQVVRFRVTSGQEVPVEPDRCLALFAAAPYVQVASTDGDGRPILRALHAVVHDGALWFHGGRKGEKQAWLGRTAVVSTEDVVARIPSWMRDPERACPATTWFESVQATGVIEEVDDVVTKAAAMQALMESLQPEGGYVPIEASHPLYEKAIRSLRVLRIVPTELVGKSKLGRHKSPTVVERVLEGLWTRGGPGDLAAIERIAAANADRIAPREAAGLRIRVHPTPHDARAAAALVANEYWNPGWSVDRLASAVLASPAWVGLERDDGTLAATARAVGDRTKRSWVYDVAVAPDLRRKGAGTGLLRLLLDHPAVRDTEVHLGTRDAMPFYERFGFEAVGFDPVRGSTHMRRRVA